MLSVLNYFRDLSMADRRRCLKALCDVTSQVGQVPELQQQELCSVVLELFREVLADTERGIQPTSCEFSDSESFLSEVACQCLQCFGYMSDARCRLFAYGPVDATA